MAEIDFSKRPNSMSMDQFESSELRKRKLASSQASSSLNQMSIDANLGNIPEFHKQAMIPNQAPNMGGIPDFHRQAMIPNQAPNMGNIPEFHKQAMVPQDIFGPALQPQQTDGGMRPMTPQEQARQAEVGAAIGRGDTAESRFQQQRQDDFANKMAEAKSGVGARAVISSLEKEGLTRDEIQAAIGGTEGKSKAQALAELQRLQRTRAKTRTDGGIDSKVRNRVVEGARFDTDEAGNQIPKNTEGRAKQFMDRADDLGPDPSSETSLYDNMKPSEKKQYDRTIASMASGTKNPNAERRLSDLITKVEKEQERKYMQKQEKVVSDELKKAERKEATAETKALLDNAKNELLEIGKAVKDKQIPKAERDRLRERQLGILDWLNDYNTGKAAAVGGAEVTDKQIKAQIPDVTEVEMAEIRKGLANGFTLEQMAGR